MTFKRTRCPHYKGKLGSIKRIGVQAVEVLEANNAMHKFTRDELVEIRARYTAKRKEILRR